MNRWAGYEQMLSCWTDCTALAMVTGKTPRAMVTGRRIPDYQPTAYVRSVLRGCFALWLLNASFTSADGLSEEAEKGFDIHASHPCRKCTVFTPNQLSCHRSNLGDTGCS